MKKILLAAATVSALVACSGKSGLEKELVGEYTGRVEMEVDSTDVGAQMVAAMISQMKMEVSINDNGTIGMNMQMGGDTQSVQGTWSVKADSLFITDSLNTTTQGYLVTKTEEGFKLADRQAILILTPKAE